MTDFRPEPQAGRRGPAPVPPLARVAGLGRRRAGSGDGPKLPARAEHHAAVGGLVLVLPALPGPGQRQGVRRPRGRAVLDGPRRTPPPTATAASTCTSAASSTPCCTCCTRGSGTRCCSTWATCRRGSRSAGCSTRATSRPTRSPTSAGSTLPAAEVEHEADGYTVDGEPVNRRSGKMGKSLKNSVSPDDMYASTARTRCGCTRCRWGRWTSTGRGGPATSSACTGSCSGCGAAGRRADRGCYGSAMTTARWTTDTARRLHQTIVAVARGLERCASTPRSPG